ncbi:MAG TPA: phosphocholine cytidylyltransferase family protein [Kofleriaceae bacterium]|nr:phosphocholine cytidylyltransferase family protein [Kofleriaceae bacterium]
MEHVGVILAAGLGSRLRPLTDTTPKCLLDVGGVTLLERQLHRLVAAGVRKSVVVVGYLQEQINDYLLRVPPPLEVVLAPNPVYATTGNCLSVLAAQRHVGDAGILIIDGDVVLTGDALARLLADRAPCSVLLDRETQLGDEEMKALLDEQGRIQTLSKKLPPAACAGESIGVNKVGGAGLQQLWYELERMERGDNQGYYEDAFQRLIDSGTEFRTVPIGHDEWTEIDDLADLDDARARFAGVSAR